MRTMLILFLLAGLVVVLLAMAQLADAESYTPRQRQVIGMIYAACDRYGLSDDECALPMFVAWRETRYGAAVVGDGGHSIGVYQYFDGGLGRYGEYYTRYGLAWRWCLEADTDMGVRLLSSHMRGGQDFRQHWRRRRDMRTMLILFLLAGLVVVLLAMAQLADAESYTPRQRQVIGMIYAACDRYGLSDDECALPMFVAWRETRYGAAVVGDGGHSIGVYQYFDGGLGRYGEYYTRYGLAWRWCLEADTDMGVRLLSSHMRGGQDFRQHWRAYSIGPWPGMPSRE